ncbi:MAG: putative toxin-antitoxin system toxin component, PIN family [Alphaproteobacteria bacterium]|nr:MAG: putative toxin-antitoxin system toxin component, PIN family [Alphaproteobacteria bacterium]
MREAVVIDTNVFISALLKADTPPREVIKHGLLGNIQPLMGNALFSEYRDLMKREHIFRNCPLSKAERSDFFDDFMSICKWINIYYLWRPNLKDEADNHLIELALAGNASCIITGNVKDFKDAELTFFQLNIVTPKTFIEERTP